MIGVERISSINRRNQTSNMSTKLIQEYTMGVLIKLSIKKKKT